ncbi:hypothetical protein E1B28_004634 [Marasmius oreades]|uniref:Uncharacterized protein n=1 Tax=Marasmius oreades TaxID=181124 RepID=A0A9P7UZ16_9AGAR|nr:uncharacterized protein E1B28_004634 [Marasmius oreades]KAG7097268.1 hypothetical protein E1B28_004634 [Marasmius oreades]
MEPESLATPKKDAIRLKIPPRLYIVPGTAFFVGLSIGFVRGARQTGLRFLAENAHRPPRTIKGWYFYNKTKNYRMLYGGGKGAVREGSKLVGISLGWVGIEEGLRWAGYPWSETAEVGAGVGTAGLFCVVYRLAWKTTRQTMVLGLLIGSCMKALNAGKDLLITQ